VTLLIASLEFFRTRCAGRPFLVLVVVVLLPLLAERAGMGAAARHRWAAAASRLIPVAALLGLTAYVLVVIWYASLTQYFDNAEPTMTAVGWLFARGQPVYHTIGSAERYAHIYGPFAFVAHGIVLGVFGPSIAASKGLGAAAALGSLGLLFLALRSVLDARRSIVLTGVYALLLLDFRNYSFWTRPEPLQLFCVAAALVLAVRSRAWMAAVFIGFFSGILWNLKITGPLYTLPILVVVYQRGGWRHAALACGTALPVALLPFALPNVSPANYLEWLALSARTGLGLATLRQNLEWAAYFGVPILLSYRTVPAEHRSSAPDLVSILLALGLATTGIVVAASKPGAGPYHLLPMLPVILYVVARYLRDAAPLDGVDPSVLIAGLGFVLVSLSIATAQQAQFLLTMRERADRNEAADIEQFADAHEGVIEMGYGSTEAFTLERPLLVFHNNSYMLDEPAVREHQLEGLDLPLATLEALRTCRVDYWLIPKGETPFSGRNSYPAVLLKPLFSDEFRRAFQQNYRPAGATTYFDVWECRRSPLP
jgi:hypothetical protein